MLKVENLKKCFGSFEAVKGISFEVKKGEVLGFLGPNGAGKSTTMRMITGFIPPTSGTAEICGHDILKDPVGAKSELGYLPEAAPSYRAMTVTDFLAFIAKIRGFSGPAAKAKVEEAIEKAKLTTVARQTIETLSKGYRQRTCFAQAILHDPKVLIMDEPTANLDYGNMARVMRCIRSLAERGISVIFTSHMPDQAFLVGAKTLLLTRGGAPRFGTAEAIVTEQNLQEAYGTDIQVLEVIGADGRPIRVSSPRME